MTHSKPYKTFQDFLAVHFDKKVQKISINAEQNAALTPYKIEQIRGATDYRNIGVGESGYWNAPTVS